MNSNSKRTKKNQSVGISAKQQSEVQRIVNSSLRANIEEKVSYVTGNAVSVPYTGVMVSAVGNIARGDGSIDAFTGNLIKPKSLRVRYTWSTDQTYSTCRVLIFRWLDASTPTTSGIFMWSNDARIAYSPLFWTNRRKIKVMYDQAVTLYPHYSGGTAAKYFDTGLIGGWPDIQFASGTTAVQMNGIYIAFVTDDILGTAPQLTYTTELIYTDA